MGEVPAATSSVLTVTLVTRMVAISVSAAAALTVSLATHQPLFALATFCLLNSVAFVTFLSRDEDPS